ncbi:pirin family protein [Alloalcanivorax sp. C16-1]|uniref:pirin family protein n=1 Tax=Alloalcanivorax sp. C16-1 TaxID=3390051 RepID=UPI0039706353
MIADRGGDDLPAWRDAGVAGQLIAGSAYGLTAGVRTHSPLFYAHLQMNKGATAEIPADFRERALYVADGTVEVGGQPVTTGGMAVLSPKASSVRAVVPATVMVLGGEPLGERFLFWNFVSSSKDRLRQAAEDWQAGRMKLPDADDQEFIPLPSTDALNHFR